MFASRSLPIRRTGITFAIALAALLTACDDTLTAPSIPGPVSTVQVIGTASPLTAGAQRTLNARLRDLDGTVLTGRSVAWTSSDVSVATVTATGLVTGVSAGATTIVARSEGREGSMRIVVQAAPVASIELSESSFILTRNSTRLVHAEARDAQGRPVTNVWLEWISEDPSVATVTSSGHVRAVASGETRIVARSGGREASVTVRVPVSIANVLVIPADQPLSIGAHSQYQVMAFDDRGREIDASRAIWSSSDPSVAIVSANGVVSGIGRGTAAITARLMYATGSAMVTVRSNNWHFEANLFHPPLVVKSDTITRSEHVLVMNETRLVRASFSYSAVTKAWTFSGELVHSNRSELQGNVIWRETGRQTVSDYGTGTEYHMYTGAILMRSAQTNAIQFSFLPGVDFGDLEGTVRGFPVSAQIVLQR